MDGYIEEKNGIVKQNKNVATNSNFIIYIWGIAYILIVFSVTLFLKQDNILIYIIYFVCAIPFIKHLDKYLMICYIISTIAYYFIGADEGIWSIYTILVILAFINIVITKRIQKQNIILFLLIVIATIISYNLSEFNYKNGLFLLIYNITIAIIIMISIKFESDTLTNFLPLLACTQVLMYAVVMMLFGVNEYGRWSISKLVDFNTFGMSVAQMGVILGVKVFIIKKSRLAYKIILIIAIMITILSGSRNAFLGLIGSLVIVYIINAKREGRIIGRLMKMMIIGSVLMIIGLIILPSFGIDLARFNYVELAESGGTNRMTLWKKVIELIIQKYMLFGYGPGHYCSSLIVSPLVNRNYAHTHNLFIEAWGELGLFGLIPFVILILITFKKCFKKYKLGLSGLMLLGIFLEMIINCIGEAHFCDIVLWIIIGSIWAYSRKGNYRIE